MWGSQTNGWRCVSERASKNSTLRFTESLKPNTSLLVQNLHTISPQPAHRHAPLPSCPHSPDLTQSGLRAKADRLLEGKFAPIWNITGSELQLQPSPFCCRVFGGFWRWNWDAPKTKAGHYLQDLSIWKMHNCRLMHKPAYRWSLTEMSKLFSLIGLKAI